MNIGCGGLGHLSTERHRLVYIPHRREHEFERRFGPNHRLDDGLVDNVRHRHTFIFGAFFPAACFWSALGAANSMDRHNYLPYHNATEQIPYPLLRF